MFVLMTFNLFHSALILQIHMYIHMSSPVEINRNIFMHEVIHELGYLENESWKIQIAQSKKLKSMYNL